MLKLFGKSSQEDWLIAGLGNPEPKYDGTRHNAGFAALDELARRWDVPADSLAIARTREQTVKENWAAKRRALLKSKY